MNVNIEELKNIIDDIQPPPLISEEEYVQIVESAGTLIHDMISNDPMIYIHPCFEDVILSDIGDLLTQQLQPMFDFDVEEYVDEASQYALNVYHTFICPRRSYDSTFIRIEPNILKMREKIEYLQSVPQPDQRTTEWYLFRHKYLTASSLWKAFGTQRAQNELIYDKCKPINVEKYKTVNTETPMHWGQKYEDVSIQWYNKTYNTQVSDFGCIPHKHVSYLAASPDGINTDASSDLYGRMLEVKNIVNREITGIPKLEYWIQMQLQMEVCELNECDFLETRFIEYENEQHFREDGDFQHTKNGKDKGVVMMFSNDGNPVYEYMPYGCTEKEYELWETEMMEKHKDLLWIRNDYWYMDQVSCVLVLRNTMWFNHVRPILDKLWSTIEYERIHGYTHRAPNKREKPSNSPPPLKCLIDIHVPELLQQSLDNVVENDKDNNITENKTSENKTSENKTSENKIPQSNEIHVDTEVQK